MLLLLLRMNIIISITIIHFNNNTISIISIVIQHVIYIYIYNTCVYVVLVKGPASAAEICRDDESTQRLQRNIGSSQRGV